MDKRRAIQIIIKAADLYHANLEDQKILFPSSKYSVVEKRDKGMDIVNCLFSDEIEKMLDRENF